MGHPKFQRKKYKAPRHPWEAERIKEENELRKEYGLKTKREIWKAAAKLRNWHTQAKNIVSLTGEEREQAEKVLLAKLNKLGVLPENANLDDVLGLTVRDVLERRLQTVLYKKGMAHTPKHARQLIVHKKVMVNGVKVSSPSYFVKAADEIAFIPGFAFKPQEVKPEQITKAPEPEVKGGEK